MGEDAGAGAAAGNLPPGFRFFPSDEELVRHFLCRKASMLPCHPDIIPTLDLCRFDPWDLHCKAFRGGSHWYFFSHRTENRATVNGFWKQVGADEPVKEVGMKSTLVFYAAGGAPEGMKTNWIMHEYRLLDRAASSGGGSNGRKPSKKKGQSIVADANRWVICRVYETACGQEEGMELSCLDEVFLSFDDYDEVSLPE